MLLFNEKAEKLLKLSFTKDIFNKDSGVHFSWKRDEALKVKRTGPGDEAIYAFVLTFRFFIQDNEKISFRNIARIYTNLDIENNLKREFDSARNFINEYLDGKTFINYNNEILS